jgi:hypothetical protein
MNAIKFDLESITKASIIVMLGRKDKCELIRDFLHNRQDITMGTIITTSKSSQIYSNLVPELPVHSEYKDSIVKDVLINGRTFIKQLIYRDFNIVRTLVILDDCFCDPLWSRNKIMRLLFMNITHMHAHLILTMQYPACLPSTYHLGIDNVFIFHESNKRARFILYTQYASLFTTFEVFCCLLDCCSEDNKCLVINYVTRNNELKDRIFQFIIPRGFI